MLLADVELVLLEVTKGALHRSVYTFVDKQLATKTISH